MDLARVLRRKRKRRRESFARAVVQRIDAIMAADDGKDCVELELDLSLVTASLQCSLDAGDLEQDHPLYQSLNRMMVTGHRMPSHLLPGSNAPESTGLFGLSETILHNHGLAALHTVRGRGGGSTTAAEHFNNNNAGHFPSETIRRKNQRNLALLEPPGVSLTDVGNFFAAVTSTTSMPSACTPFPGKR